MNINRKKGLILLTIVALSVILSGIVLTTYASDNGEENSEGYSRFFNRKMMAGTCGQIRERMHAQFGVATSICAGEVKSVLKEAGSLSDEDLVAGYRQLLEDFARFAVEHRFDLIEIEFGFSLIGADRLMPLHKQLKEIIRPFRTVCCHLPLGEINIAALNPEIRRVSVAETLKHIDDLTLFQALQDLDAVLSFDAQLDVNLLQPVACLYHHKLAPLKGANGGGGQIERIFAALNQHRHLDQISHL